MILGTPAYSQLVRDPEIRATICNPNTVITNTGTSYAAELTVTKPTANDSSSQPAEAPSSPAESSAPQNSFPWIWVGIGAAVVIAAAAVCVVLLKRKK